MHPLEDAVDAMAHDTSFSGVVRVDRSGAVELAKAYGLADRGHAIANTIETQFAIASATKGLTALAVVGLIDDGSLNLDTTARSILGGDPAHRRPCDGRTSARASLGHRGLPRRGSGS